jgi:hypothetical protein
MNRLSTSLLCTLVLNVACVNGDTSSTPNDTPAHESTPPSASVGSSSEVIELQSSGSLRFKVVAGRVDNGWCAHLVDEADGPSAWRADDCTISTGTAAAESISYAIAGAPADPEVKVLYGLIAPIVSKVVVEVVSGSVTSSLQASPARRRELGDVGSFSLFVRPSMGTPVRLRLLATDGSEVRTIDL